MPKFQMGANMDDRVVTKMIAVRARRGESLEAIARTSRISYVRVRRLARLAGVRYKHKRATPEQIQSAIAAVRDKGCTFRAAAEACKMSRTAVHRFVSQMRQKSIDSAGELKLIDGDRPFSRKKQSWLCETHGQITVFPCVACAAECAREAARKRRGAGLRSAVFDSGHRTARD